VENVYVMHRQDADSEVARAIIYYYMDYYKKEIRSVYLPDPGVFPWEEASSESRLFLVGFTPGYEDFSRLISVAGDLIWIDNDMESVAQIEAKSTNELNFRRIKGKRTKELSLCELTWQSYFAWIMKLPEIVDLVGRYTMKDTDRPDWDSRIVPFNLGLRLKKTDPLDPTVFEEFWKKILCMKRDLEYEASVINGIIAMGKKRLYNARDIS
jgi:hypothetical protein